MSSSSTPPRTRKLLLTLVIVSWVVFGLRILGELFGWGAPWVGDAGKEAGGGGALLGISWLMPIAGIAFAWALERGGHGPKHPGRGLILTLIGLAVLAVGVGIGYGLIKIENDGAYAIMVGATAGGLIALSGWPALGVRLLLYGLLVRAAVILVTFPAVFGEWGTHLEKPHPDVPPMEPMDTAIALSLAQAFFWVPATMVIGGVVGGVIALVVDKRRGSH